MNRRQFLPQSGAAVAAAISLPAILHAAEAPRRIPIGFFGAT